MQASNRFAASQRSAASFNMQPAVRVGPGGGAVWREVAQRSATAATSTARASRERRNTRAASSSLRSPPTCATPSTLCRTTSIGAGPIASCDDGWLFRLLPAPQRSCLFQRSDKHGRRYFRSSSLNLSIMIEEIAPASKSWRQIARPSAAYE